MNYHKTRNNVVEAWLLENYSTMAMLYQLAHKGKDESPPFFARNWDLE